MVSPLWKACFDGDIEKVNELLREPSIDIELKDHTGVTPLIVAVRNGHYDVVKALLERGADPLNGSSQARPDQYTSDPAILDLLNYAQNKVTPNGVATHEVAYSQDASHDADKAYYPSPPPSGPYSYYPTINPALSAVGEGGVYYPPAPPQSASEMASVNNIGNLPPPEIARLIPCRYFPACRYGVQCLFAHPQPTYYQGSVPPSIPYPGYDPMGAPYAPPYYPVAQSYHQQNGVHPMSPVSPPPSGPHMMHSRSASEVLSPSQAHFSPNGLTPSVPYGSLPPSGYPHTPIPMSLPPPPHLHHQSHPPPAPQSPPNMYHNPSAAPPFVVHQDAPGQYSQLPNPVNYQDIDGTIKSPPSNGQTDTYPPQPVHRDGVGHHRRGTGARRGTFASRKPPCSFFPSGRCKNGDDCRFPHLMPDNSGPHHHNSYFAGRGAASRSRGSINGVATVAEKLEGLTFRNDSSHTSVSDGSSDPVSRPKFQQGVKHHNVGINNAHGNKKFAYVKPQRVPNADEFPVLAGSTTPPSRGSGHHSNGTGHSGPTAAQVLQAPPPARKEGSKESSKESSTRGATPDPVPVKGKPEVNGSSNQPVVASEPSAHKLPLSFAAITTAAAEGPKEVSVPA